MDAWCRRVLFWGQDHLVIHLHIRENITFVIEKLKSKHPTTLFTAEDLSAICATTDVDDEEEAGHSSELV